MVIGFRISTPQLQKEACNLVSDSYEAMACLSLEMYHSFQAIALLLCGHKCNHPQQRKDRPSHPVTKLNNISLTNYCKRVFMKTMKATITVDCQQTSQDWSHVFFLPLTTCTKYMGL